jgi:hypothetical protein
MFKDVTATAQVQEEEESVSSREMQKSSHEQALSAYTYEISQSLW